MQTRCSLLLLCLLFNMVIANSTSNFIIAKRGKQFDCIITSDNGEALSWNDENDHFAFINKVSDFIPQLDSNESFTCPIARDLRCSEFWTKSPWLLTNSLIGPITQKPVKDRRWETFASLSGTGKSIEFDETLPLSVKAKSEMEIKLCNPTKLCYKFVINNSKKTTFKNDFSLETIMTLRNDTNFLNSRWMNMELVKNENLSLYEENHKVVLAVSGDSHKDYKVEYFKGNVTLSSGNDTVLRLQLYEYIYTTNESQTKLGPQMKYSNNTWCISLFVMMCENCQMNISVKDENATVEHTIGSFQSMTKWTLIKLNTSNYPFNPTKFDLYVKTSLINNNSQTSTKSPFWAIDDVRQCQVTEYRRLTFYSEKSDGIYCQLMNQTTGQTIRFPSDDDDIRNVSSSDFTVGNSVPCQWIYENVTNCENVTYCLYVLNEIKCYSSIEFDSKNCSSVCENGFCGCNYGDNDMSEEPDSSTVPVTEFNKILIVTISVVSIVLVMGLVLISNKWRKSHMAVIAESNLGDFEEHLRNILEIGELEKKFKALELRWKISEPNKNDRELDLALVDGYSTKLCFFISQRLPELTPEIFWFNIWRHNVKFMIAIHISDTQQNEEQSLWPVPNSPLNLRNDTFCISSVPIISLGGKNTYERQTYEIKMRGRIKKITCLKFVVNMSDFLESSSEISKSLFKLPLNPSSPIMLHSCGNQFRIVKMLLFCDWCLRMVANRGEIDLKAGCEKLYAQGVGFDDVASYKEAIMLLRHCLKIESESLTSLEILNDVGRISTNDFIKLQTHFLSNQSKTSSYIKNDVENDLYASSGIRVKLENDFPFLNVVSIEDSVDKHNEFLITKVPESYNVGDFWRLVAQTESSKILFLNGFSNAVLPASNECSYVTSLGEINIKIVTNKGANNFHLIMIHLSVQEKNIKNAIEIFIFNQWPANSDLPQDRQGFFEFIDETKINFGQTLIVCRDGIRASGLFVSVVLLRENILKHRVCNIPRIVKTIRRNCGDFVTNQVQLQFLYVCARICFLQEPTL